MDTRGALILVWDAERQLFANTTRSGPDAFPATVPIPFIDDDGYANILALYNVPVGTVSLYSGNVMRITKGVLGFPFQIDWRLHHGVACSPLPVTRPQDGIFDTIPIAGSTLVLKSDESDGNINREGMLFQAAGLMADCYLLRAKAKGSALDGSSAQGTQIIASIIPKVLPGLTGSVFGITVGSMIG